MIGTLMRDGASLRLFDAGAGRPIVFQHGLGGDAAQVAENLPSRGGWRALTLECRGHGGSQAGTVRPFSIAQFAEDVLDAADASGADRFAVGGLSMGAAIALRIAALHPGRVTGLILGRPAWVFDPAPPNMRPFAEVAALLRAHPPGEARRRFADSSTAQMLAAAAPDNLASLLRFFDRPDPMVTADLLHDIAADGPGVTAAQVAHIAVPTLVIGNPDDAVHPLAAAAALADAVPAARLVTIASKAADRPHHFAEMHDAIAAFLYSLERPT